jgi:septum formation protein
MTELILASTSVYRRELMSRLGLPFQALAPSFEEEPYKGKGSAPLALAETLAAGKARSLASHQNCVIGGDQLVSFHGQILGKPKTFERACEQLSMMSGHTHELITAVMVIHQGREIPHTDRTKMKMRELTRTQIETYVKAELPYDCAGSYKIEARGITLFEKIDSEDFTAIQGLPLVWLTKILSSVGYPL